MVIASPNLPDILSSDVVISSPSFKDPIWIQRSDGGKSVPSQNASRQHRLSSKAPYLSCSFIKSWGEKWKIISGNLGPSRVEVGSKHKGSFKMPTESGQL